MPLALFAAFAGSLAIHVTALFLPDVELSTAPEAPLLQAEIHIPQAPTVAAAKAVEPVKPPPAKSRREKNKEQQVRSQSASESKSVAPVEVAPTAIESQPAPLPAKIAESQLPAHGGIRYAVYRGTQGLDVGRAVHEWEFNPDGTYRIRITTETSGLAALFKPVRIEMESRGRFVAGGLQPEHLITLRDGAETNENAEFDWNARQVTLSRGGKRYDLADGAQDVVSFHYQLIFVPQLANGTSIGVATGKKFERYRFDAVGEEILETPAGSFRTLHVRVQTDSTTELWLALERQLLPIKIRHTDRKGESFEQIALELRIPTP